MEREYLQLTRRDLYELAWSKPMQELAKDFGISDVGLAKQFRKLGIPVPGRGYWAKVASGQKPYQPKLPERKGEEPSDTAIAMSVGTPRADRVDTEDADSHLPADQAATRSRIRALSITPSNDLTAALATVKRTAKHLRHPRRADLVLARRERSGPIVSLDVTDATLDRALHLADTLLRAAESLGWSFTAPPPPKPTPEGHRPQYGYSQPEPSPKPAPAIGHLLVDGEVVRFRIEERMKEEPRTRTAAELAREKREYGYHAARKTVLPTAALRVVRLDPESRYFEPSRRSWYDRKTHRVEEHIADILDGFYDLALSIRARRLKAEQREREHQEQEHLEREREQRREANTQLIKQLETTAGAWHRARALRAYIRATRRRLGTNTLEAGFLGQSIDFLAWAERYINQLDPLHETPRHPDMTGPQHYYRASSDLSETLSRLSGQDWEQSWKLGGEPREPEEDDD